MAPNYSVQYAFEHSDSELRPEGNKYGFGVIVVNTDKHPETPEDMKEIARTIGKLRTPQKTEDYKAVGILNIEPTERTIDDSDTILEGEIVL